MDIYLEFTTRIEQNIMYIISNVGARNLYNTRNVRIQGKIRRQFIHTRVVLCVNTITR